MNKKAARNAAFLFISIEMRRDEKCDFLKPQQGYALLYTGV
jgi:hypothetical protein